VTRLATIDRAMTDRKLLDLGGASWLIWRSIWKAAHAEPLTAEEAEAFAKVSGGRKPPSRRVRRLVAAASRRSAKSRMAAAKLVYSATMVDHTSGLAPGEVPVSACISPTKEQSKVILGYAVGFLKSSPLLRGLLAGEPTSGEIRLRNGHVIRCLSADYRTIRGWTLSDGILDEASFLRDESSAASDIEAAGALEPALATLGGMLCIFSSPFKKSGLLFNLHRDYFATDSDDTLVVAGESRLFNPTIDQGVIDAARQSDPQAALSEWLGEFRPDISDYLDEELIDRATDHGGVAEVSPRPGVAYVCFVDSSGGTSGDSYTIAIAHKVKAQPIRLADGRVFKTEEDDKYVLDVIRGTPRARTFDPHKVTKDYAKLCKQYNITQVVGDAYGREWVMQCWRDCGLQYVTSERTKVEIYLEALPLFTRGQVTLRPNEILLRELRLLERKTTRTGRDFVGHPPRGRDDYANAALGALVMLQLDVQPMIITRAIVEAVARQHYGRRLVAGDPMFGVAAGNRMGERCLVTQRC
jgi:hypothetical protein